MNKLDRKEYDKKYYQENREKILAQHKERLEKNPEYRKEYNKKWQEDNKEHIKEYQKEYNRKWRQNNFERIKQYQIRWGQKNKEHLLEYARKHSKTEVGKAGSQRRCFKRRTTFKKLINTLTAKEWLDILEQYNYRCVYCGCEFEVENMPTRDHIIPISKGGHNTKDNIVPACRSCNSSKGNRIIREKEILLCKQK